MAMDIPDSRFLTVIPEGMKRVMEAAARHRVQKFVFVSSLAAVNGGLGGGGLQTDMENDIYIYRQKELELVELVGKAIYKLYIYIYIYMYTSQYI